MLHLFFFVVGFDFGFAMDILHTYYSIYCIHSIYYNTNAKNTIKFFMISLPQFAYLLGTIEIALLAEHVEDDDDGVGGEACNEGSDRFFAQ